MKKLLIVFMAVFLPTSCNGWFFQSSPYNPPTPFLPPTQTPLIVSATPVVIGAATSTPVVATPILFTNTPFLVDTNTPFGPPSDTPSATSTLMTPVLSVSLEVLGCNTSIDITHGMGEVTNAFVTLRNNGNVELRNLRATLLALDEGREHPDKTVEIVSLPAAHQVSLKLTVDSTYREETPIQIEVLADGGLFHRVGEASCRDIGLFAPNPASLHTPVPVNP